MGDETTRILLLPPDPPEPGDTRETRAARPHRRAWGWPALCAGCLLAALGAGGWVGIRLVESGCVG